MKTLFPICFSAMLAGASLFSAAHGETSESEDPKAKPPTWAQIARFQSGDIQFFSEYMEDPVIMVAVFDRKITTFETPRPTLNKVWSRTYARVVQTASPDFKVGDIVTFPESKEGLSAVGLYQLLHPRAQLFYLIHPTVDWIEKEIGVGGEKILHLKEGRWPILVSRREDYYTPRVYQN